MINLIWFLKNIHVEGSIFESDLDWRQEAGCWQVQDDHSYPQIDFQPQPNANCDVNPIT